MSILTNMIVLSTGHVPGPEPSFGDIRFCSHEYGWILFVANFEDIEFQELVPDWLKPIYRYAINNNCVIINFDRDGDLLDQFPSWIW